MLSVRQPLNNIMSCIEPGTEPEGKNSFRMTGQARMRELIRVKRFLVH